MTKGILDPQHYYYRRVFTDAVRAIEAARSHPAVDASQIAVTGGSQGGGITIAAAGLVPDVVAAMPDVPFLCHYRRATELVDTYPYKEIAEFCHALPAGIDEHPKTPGTLVLVFVFLAAFAVYYFVNWKLLSVVWKVG